MNRSRTCSRRRQEVVGRISSRLGPPPHGGGYVTRVRGPGFSRSVVAADVRRWSVASPHDWVRRLTAAATWPAFVVPTSAGLELAQDALDRLEVGQFLGGWRLLAVLNHAVLVDDERGPGAGRAKSEQVIQEYAVGLGD